MWNNHEAASPDVTRIDATKHLETAVRMESSKIVHSNKTAGVNIGEVNNIDSTRNRLRCVVNDRKGIIFFSQQYFHPRRASEQTVSQCISLRE